MNSSKKSVIGLVDPIRSATALVDEVKRRGIPCVIVSSGLISPVQAEGCTHVDTHTETDVVVKLRALGVTYLLAGCDPVIEYTDRLQAQLGFLSNGIGLSNARRDKGPMEQAVRAAGVRTPHTLHSNNLAEVQQWAKVAGFPLVIKPATSGGTDNVHRVEDQRELAEHFAGIVGNTNLMGIVDTHVVVQEFIEGTEYVIDTVTFSGQHVVTDILCYTKAFRNGRHFIYEKSRILPADTELSQRLVAFAKAALTALDVHSGPAHMEVILNTLDELVFIEVGARLAGGQLHLLPRLARADGLSQVELSISAALGEQPPTSDYKLRAGAVKVFINADQDGTVTALRYLDTIRQLKSFSSMYLHAHIGDKISKTCDLAHTYGAIYLSHIDSGQLCADERTLDSMLNDGIFEFALPKSELITQVKAEVGHV